MTECKYIAISDANYNDRAVRAERLAKWRAEYPNDELWWHVVTEAGVVETPCGSRP